MMHNSIKWLVPASSLDDPANHFLGAFLGITSPYIKAIGLALLVWGLVRGVWCWFSPDQRRHTEGLKHAVICFLVGGVAWLAGAQLAHSLGVTAGTSAHDLFGL